jgi:pimeloyl-ACP methyl ester carboxylesterase
MWLRLILLFIGVLLSGLAQAEPVLLVLSPGFSFEEHRGLIDEIRRRDHELHIVGSSCAAPGLESLRQEIRSADLEFKGSYTLIAHSVGASVALQVAPEIKADHYILLAPVLGVSASRGLEYLMTLDIHSRVELAQELAWGEDTLQGALLGKMDYSGCLSMGVARDLRSWVREGKLSLPLSSLEVPVWIGTSLGDELSPVEVLVPLSRTIKGRRLVRFGLNRFDPQDYSHGELLMSKRPVRSAVKQIGAGR